MLSTLHKEAASGAVWICQSGCLAIEGYKPRRDIFLLDFSNNKVRRGFVSLVESFHNLHN